MRKKFEFLVLEEFHKKRLDEFLFAAFPSLSKMYLRDLLKNEKCEVNGYQVNAGWILKANDFVEVEADPQRETAMKPEKMRIDVVYEDDHILVVNKPAGLLVHPTHREKNGTLLNGLSFYLNSEMGITNSEKSEIPNRTDPESKIQAPKSPTVRPGLVHRLDKATSGLIVATKTQRALRVLSDHFKRKLVSKTYFALVEGLVKEDHGEIRAPIGRFADEKRWDVKADGKIGITNYWVRKRSSDTTLIELEPVTGRTNQLRIHCASIGHPIIGDTAYGGRTFPRLCLHAARLKFHHPANNEVIEVEIDLPEEMKARDPNETNNEGLLKAE